MFGKHADHLKTRGQTMRTSRTAFIRNTPALATAFFLLVALGGGCNPQAPVAERVQPVRTIDQPYEYPLKPGDPEWKNLNGNIAMLSAVQIPGEILQVLSTKALAKSVLEYPLFMDIWAYDEETGFKHLAANFNGLRDLLAREDAGPALLEEYRAFDPAGFKPQLGSDGRGFHSFRLRYLEMIMGQPSILAQLSPEQRKLLVQTALAQAKIKANYPDIYGVITPTNLIRRTLEIDFPEKFTAPDGSRLATSSAQLLDLAKKLTSSTSTHN